MKVHYINILLFSLPLNILVHNRRNHKSTTHHTQTNRSLCECELYSPANYDNDQEMKRVMQQFEDRTTQRFHEYDDRMIEKRKQCKDKCDKEIQKIILKDKLEKQMAQHFDTLQTDIQSDAIPTCVCEKSLADKVEKGCLRCTQNLGGIVAPSSGVLAGIAEAALSVWKPAALKAAAKYALTEGAAVGKFYGDVAGMNVVIGSLKILGVQDVCPKAFESILEINHYSKVTNFAGLIFKQKSQFCSVGAGSQANVDMCTKFEKSFGLINERGDLIAPPGDGPIKAMLEKVVDKATTNANYFKKNTSKTVTDILTSENTNLINTIYGSWQTAIIASVIAIVVIVLIMVIIYKILRYRRKKKMKKKLQYIKLLEE